MESGDTNLLQKRCTCIVGLGLTLFEKSDSSITFTRILLVGLLLGKGKNKESIGKRLHDYGHLIKIIKITATGGAWNQKQSAIPGEAYLEY